MTPANGLPPYVKNGVELSETGRVHRTFQWFGQNYQLGSL